MPPKNEIVRILFFQAGSRVREQFRLTFLIVSQLRAKVERFPKKHHLCHQKNNKWHDFRRDPVPNTTGIDRSAAGKPSVRLIARNAGSVRRAESGPGCVLLKCSRLVGFRFGRKRPCGGRFFRYAKSNASRPVAVPIRFTALKHNHWQSTVASVRPKLQKNK